jgi:hypothetical protein
MDLTNWIWDHNYELENMDRLFKAKHYKLFMEQMEWILTNAPQGIHEYLCDPHNDDGYNREAYQEYIKRKPKRKVIRVKVSAIQF